MLCSSQNAPRLRSGYSAGAPDVALPARGCATRLRWPTACRWPGGDTLRSAARRACIFATASSDPGRSLSMRGIYPRSIYRIITFTTGSRYLMTILPRGMLFSSAALKTLSKLFPNATRLPSWNATQ